MKNTQPEWQWEEGEVDERKEHIELRYGKAGETPYENWMPIARIAKLTNNIFAVEWLLKQDSSEHQIILNDARHELDFYLVEKGEPDPWAYALYHCGTGANMYSRVHWSYFQTGNQEKRYASKILKLSTEDSQESGKATP